MKCEPYKTSFTASVCPSTAEINQDLMLWWDHVNIGACSKLPLDSPSWITEVPGRPLSFLFLNAGCGVTAVSTTKIESPTSPFCRKSAGAAPEVDEFGRCRSLEPMSSFRLAVIQWRPSTWHGPDHSGPTPSRPILLGCLYLWQSFRCPAISEVTGCVVAYLQIWKQNGRIFRSYRDPIDRENHLCRVIYGNVSLVCFGASSSYCSGVALGQLRVHCERGRIVFGRAFGLWVVGGR